MLLDGSEDFDKPYLGGERVSMVHKRIATRSVPAVNCYRTPCSTNTQEYVTLGCTAARTHTSQFVSSKFHPRTSSQCLHIFELFQRLPTNFTTELQLHLVIVVRNFASVTPNDICRFIYFAVHNRQEELCNETVFRSQLPANILHMRKSPTVFCQLIGVVN